MSSSSQAILRHVSWAAIGAWGSRLATLGIFVLLARLLSPDAIGAVALIASYLAILQLIGEGGLAEYLLQKTERDDVQEQSVFWAQFAFSSALAVALFFAAPLVARTLSSNVPGEDLIRAMAVILPLAAAGRVAEALMRKALEFKKLAYRNLVAAVLGGSAGVACAFAGAGIWALVVKYIVEALFSLIALMVAARWRPKLRFDGTLLREPTRYGVAILGARAITLLHSRLDIFVVGGVLGSAALGYYSVAQRMFQVVGDMFNAVSGSVAVPVLAASRSDPPQLKAAFARLVRGGSLLSMTAYAGLAAVAPLIVSIVFGPNWAPAAGPLQWLALAGFLAGPLWFNGGVMLATGRAGTWMLVVAGYALVGAVVLPIGAVLAGITGVAMATSLRTLLLAPISVHLTLSTVVTTISEYVAAWGPGAVIACAVGAAMWGITQLTTDLLPAISLTAAAAVGGVVFAIAVWKMLPGVMKTTIGQFSRRRN